MVKKFKNKLGLMLLLPLSAMVITTPLTLASCASDSNNSNPNNNTTIPGYPILKPEGSMNAPRINVVENNRKLTKQQIENSYLFSTMKSNFVVRSDSTSINNDFVELVESTQEFKDELSKGNLFKFINVFAKQSGLQIKSISVAQKDATDGKNKVDELFQVTNNNELIIKVNIDWTTPPFDQNTHNVIESTIKLKPHLASHSDLNEYKKVIKSDDELSKEFLNEKDGNKNIFNLASESLTKSNGGFAGYSVYLTTKFQKKPTQEGENTKEPTTLTLESFVPLQIDDQYTIFNFDKKTKLNDDKSLRDLAMLELRRRYVWHSAGSFHKGLKISKRLKNEFTTIDLTTTNQTNDFVKQGSFLNLTFSMNTWIGVNVIYLDSQKTENNDSSKNGDITTGSLSSLNKLYDDRRGPFPSIKDDNSESGPYDYLKFNVKWGKDSNKDNNGEMLLIPYIAGYDDIMFESLRIKSAYELVKNEDDSMNDIKPKVLTSNATNTNANLRYDASLDNRESLKKIYDEYVDWNKNRIYPQFLNNDLGKGGGMFGFLSCLILKENDGRVKDWTHPFFTPFDFKEKVVSSSGAGQEQEKTYYKYIDQNKIIHKIYG